MSFLSKKQVREYVDSEGMTLVMNDTRWRNLFRLLSDNDKFWYRVYNVDGSSFPEDGASFTPELAAVGCGSLWSIEWFDIQSKFKVSKHALLAPELIDFTSDLVEIANAAGAKFTWLEEGIRVWGYVRRGVNAEFACAPNHSLKLDGPVGPPT